MKKESFVVSALGDAWGYPYEFKTYGEIVQAGARMPDTLVVSDDTQMAIATFEATREIIDRGLNTKDDCVAVYNKHYLKWYKNPLNNRAPGTTCMSALAELDTNKRAMDTVADNDSMGCGTIMRTPVIALFDDLTDVEVYTLATWASQCTHGNELGNRLAGVYPVLLRRVNEHMSPSYLMECTLEVLREYSFDRDFPEFFARLLILRDVFDEVYPQFDTDVNMCDFTGEGWTTDDCFVAGVLAGMLALTLDDKDVYTSIRRLILSDGDTDSLACVGGWMIGCVGQLDNVGGVVSIMESTYRDWFTNYLKE